jgi:hypothetical protein
MPGAVRWVQADGNPEFSEKAYDINRRSNLVKRPFHHGITRREVPALLRNSLPFGAGYAGCIKLSAMFTGRRKTALVASLFVASISACQSQPINPIAWTRESVVGLTIELVDPTTIEQLNFGKEGFVAVSVGTKGGPIIGPLLRWSIVAGRLQIGEGERAEQLTLVKRTSSRITAKRRSGMVVEYKILGPPRT